MRPTSEAYLKGLMLASLEGDAAAFLVNGRSFGIFAAGAIGFAAGAIGAPLGPRVPRW